MHNAVAKKHTSQSVENVPRDLSIVLELVRCRLVHAHVLAHEQRIHQPRKVADGRLREEGLQLGGQEQSVSRDTLVTDRQVQLPQTVILDWMCRVLMNMLKP